MCEHLGQAVSDKESDSRIDGGLGKHSECNMWGVRTCPTDEAKTCRVPKYFLKPPPHPFDRSLCLGEIGGTIVYRHP